MKYIESLREGERINIEGEDILLSIAVHDSLGWQSETLLAASGYLSAYFLAEPVSDIIAATVTAATFFSRFDKILDRGAGKV